MNDNDNVYICRCEDITLEDINKIIESGTETIDEIKRLSRCSMGPCGGKTCSNLLMDVISKTTKTPIANIKPGTFRPPAKNVLLGILAKEGEE
jgi:NAD(P)H-nitrite reductase large subunit